MRLLLALPLSCLGLGCDAEAPRCDETTCKPFCESTDAADSARPFGLNEAQAALIAPLAEDIAAGVRSWDDTSTGICAGRGKDCESFVGRDPEGPLPEGEYMLRAELRVPKVGKDGTWQVRYELACDVVIPEEGGGERTRSYSRTKTYDIRYIGSERGYRLSPLHTIEAPRKQGTETCRYTLTGLGPTETPPIEGGWTVGPPEATPETAGDGPDEVAPEE